MTPGTEDAHHEPGRPVAPLIDTSTEAIGAAGGLAGGMAWRAPRAGRTRVLDTPGGTLLGAGPQAGYPVTGLETEPGALLALYTDGLVERPGTGIGAPRAALARYGDPASPAPDHSLAAVAGRLTARARHAADRPHDIALLLAVRRPGGPGRRTAVACPARGRRAGTRAPVRTRRPPARGAVRAGARHGSHAATAAPVPYRPARAAPRARGNVSRLPEPGSVDMGTWSG